MAEPSQPPGDLDGANRISLDLLQQRLHHRLETTGVLDRLRAQLRKQVLSELRGAGARSCDDRTKQYSTLDRAFNAIIADFLHRHDHIYALSVFLSESSTDPDLFKACDLERLLCLPELSIEDNKSTKSILAILVELAARLNSNSLVSCAIQTDSRSDELESSLRLIDQKFRRLANEEDAATQQCFEERISKQIREVEQRAADTLKQEIERIRITEIAAARISEHEKHQQELDIVRQQYERQYQERLEQLRVKDQEQNQILQKRKQALESLEYERRQQLLAEFETIKLRDTDLKRGVELEKRALQLERETLRKELEEAKRRADVFEKELERKAYAMELSSAEYDTSHRYLHDQDKIELEYVIKDYNDKRKWLDQEKENNEKCKQQLEEAHEQLRIKELELKELLELKTKLLGANTTISQLQKELDEVFEAKKSLEMNLTLRNQENEALNSQLKTLEKQLQDERQQFEICFVSLKSDHELALQVYKSESSKQQKYLQSQILALSKELSDRLDKEDQVQMKYEDEQLRSKSLWREVTGLKSYIDELQSRNKTRITKKPLEKFDSNYYQQTREFVPKKYFSYLEFEPQDQTQGPTNNENLFDKTKQEVVHHRANRATGSDIHSREANEKNVQASKEIDQENKICEAEINYKEKHELVVDSIEHEYKSERQVDVSDAKQINDINSLTRNENMFDESRDDSHLDIDHAGIVTNSADISNNQLSAINEPNPECNPCVDDANSVSNQTTDLSTYLITEANDHSAYDEKTLAKEIKMQNEMPDAISEPNAFIETELNEIVEEKKEESEENLKRREAMEKKREEMILRAAQQRKEKDERERRERLSSRRSHFTINMNNATVSRAPPVKRNFDIGDKV